MTRRRIPTAQKILNGNPGRRPLPENEPKPTGAVGNPPDWLCEIGLYQWDRTKAILEPLGLLTELDTDFFALYCDSYAEYVRMTIDIQNEGTVVESPKGATYQNPKVGQKNKAAEKMIKIGARFGMSPADRNGLEVDTSIPEEDEIALMMEGGF